MPDAWISTQDQNQARPTRHTQQVWCYDTAEGVTTGYYHGWQDRHGLWHDNWSMDNEYGLYVVTHWRPLHRPSPPGAAPTTPEKG
jgi:hypothetical protein